MRALAVIAVFFSHKAPNWAGDSGHFGVELFFALSGFLIVGILNRERLAIEAKRKSVGGALRTFLFRRTLRIFPIYYLTLTVLALLAFLDISTIDWNPVGHIFHIFYLSNVWIDFIQKSFIGAYSHLWSLSIEEQFYLLAAPLLLFAPPRMHIAICAIVVGVGLATHGAILAAGRTDLSYVDFGSIGLGGVAALVCKQDKWRLGGDAFLAIAIGSFGMTWAALFIAHGWLTQVLTSSVPIMAVLIVVLVYTSQSGLIVAALEWKPLVHLGRISYGFYLYHNFIGFTLFGNPDFFHQSATVLLEFLVVIIVAELSWYLIERPLISLAKARNDIRRAEPRYYFIDRRSAVGRAAITTARMPTAVTAGAITDAE